MKCKSLSGCGGPIQCTLASKVPTDERILLAALLTIPSLALLAVCLNVALAESGINVDVGHAARCDLRSWMQGFHSRARLSSDLT